MQTEHKLEKVKHNVYFDGMVQSLAFDAFSTKATVGVMRPGQYQFGTAGPELMTIVAGVLKVKLPGSDWKSYGESESFEVEENEKFDVQCDADVAYVCYYK